MYSLLSADSAVVAALGVTGVMVPDEAIPTEPAGDPNVPALTLAQTFGGGISVAKRMGAPIAQVELYWELTGWYPSFQRSLTEPLMLAVMAALIGPETKGKTHHWVDPSDSRPWSIDVDFVSEEPVPLDTTTPQPWAPVRHRYRVALRPRS